MTATAAAVPGLVDQASEAIRQTNHHTITVPLDVAETYAALGALAELINRLPQALTQTVRGVSTDPSVRSDSGAVAQDLAAINDHITQAATALGTAAAHINAAHNHAALLHT